MYQKSFHPVLKYPVCRPAGGDETENPLKKVSIPF